jgi:hypothetical protein
MLPRSSSCRQQDGSVQDRAFIACKVCSMGLSSTGCGLNSTKAQGPSLASTSMACLKRTGFRRFCAQYSGPHSGPCTHASQAVERSGNLAGRGESPRRPSRSGSSSGSMCGP